MILHSLSYLLAPQGAGRPIPNRLVPLANSTLPPLGNALADVPPNRSPPKKLGLPPNPGDAKGEDPAPAPTPPKRSSGGRSSGMPTPNESRFDRKLLLAFVNDPRPASDFLGSGLPKVNGSGAGMSTCLDTIGFGGGLAGDAGPSLSLSLSLSRSRSLGRGIPYLADWKPLPLLGPESPGRAYSSCSDAQYSAARVALVTSLLANRLKLRS
jgi:hypothetical protein